MSTENKAVITGIQPDFAGPASETGHAKVLKDLARLMGDIAEARASAAHNEKLLAGAQQRFAAEFFPLLEGVIRWKRACLTILLKHLAAGWMRKRQQQKIAEMVDWLAYDLQENFGADISDQIKGYVGVYFETEQERDEIDKEQEAFGTNFEEFMGFFKESKQGGAEEPFGHSTQYGGRQDRRPKQKTKAQQREEEKENSLLSDMRGLYLMLARALHPDKENNAERRVEKTAWMQKVTAAYQARNLHSLFDILARNPLNALGPYLSETPVATLKAYAKRLRRELTALRSEAAALLEDRDPRVAGFFHQGRFDEPAFRREIAAIRRMAKAAQSNAKGLTHREGVLELIDIM